MNKAILHTASGVYPLSLRIANDFPTRLRGLILAPPLAHDQGLLLPRCSSIHTAFMRQAIDVIYLDRDGKILHCVASLKPWRASARWRASQVLELADGSITQYTIAPGDQLLR